MDKHRDSFYLGRFFAVTDMWQHNEINSDRTAIILCARITSDYKAGKTPDDVIAEVLSKREAQ